MRLSIDIASAAAVIIAGILALHDKPIWGWFLFVAVIIAAARFSS